MNLFKDTMIQAMAGMNLQSKRIGVTSENISNVDTPGYKRKLLTIDKNPTIKNSFAETLIELDPKPVESTYDPTHPLADQDGYILGSNVDLVIEMADMREASRMYEANLNSFQQAKNMYRSLLEVLRR
ncbi:MAG: flagellar basal body rod C-terminal domain-containing protein [Pseudomonadota bacterium]